jgi:hypothetical protein
MAQVVGKRSPMWAFWSRMLINCQGGIPYLARLRLIQTPWFGIYLHDIYEPDGDRDCHNHPWTFISVVLRGSYTERVYPYPDKKSYNYHTQHHRRFSAHKMGRKEAHRITYASPRLKTLIFTGKRQSGWGFFIDGQYTRWQDYEYLGEVQ